MAMQIEMPKYVDSLPQLLWWEMDEVAAAIAVFGVGLLIHYTITSLFVVALVMKIIRKMKNDGLNGTAFQVMCSTGLVSLNKDFPDLLQKDFYL